ncbi:hypothetical protein SAMN05660649_00009 [Desulfotomaculum arcticum]|uniref:Uncharacterized protein n=1 Tax=Desulfotruncus arcticus DSM 17038 TaxID=1121424 RepID=A0A1I2MNQ2_9FIRM|nr:hypothetical protein [Desulfotruncus arcticus]SFF92319.1 hypothetical protein SAMN05660649_00009 [Desulfotomaculum arcticum] [Desulfotruncus arcticus DSM 17038]
MAIISKCALCNQIKELRESHIIPDFAGRWLKKSSATGYLRQATTPNRRSQDLFKCRLLCNDCELLFSRFEKQFAEKIFIPFQNGQKFFHYDEWLLKFIISINWRVAILEIINQKNNLPQKLDKELGKAVSVWKDYLLNNSRNMGPYKNHIFFLDTIESVTPGTEVIDHTNWYLLRTTDATVANSKQVVFAYSKLPGIILVSHIFPHDIKGWSKTRIYKRGTVKIPQSCEVPGFGDFLNHRITETNKLVSQMSETQREKINETIEKNPSRVLNSKSLEAILADQKLKN